ncbi:MAG: DUF3108 domain-containing protein [Burkholderiaceae bacterium]
MIVVVSLLVHLALLDALPHWTLEAGDPPQSDEPLRVTLMPAIRPAEIPQQEPPTPRAAEPVARSAPHRRKVAPAPFIPESAEPVPEVIVSSTAAPPAAQPQPQPPVSAPTPAPTPTPNPEPPVAPPPTTPQVPAVAPASAQLLYKVASVDTKNADPTHFYGIGSIDWTIDDGHYRSDLKATLQMLFIRIDVLALHSEGAITPAGLAPDRYTETPRKRATVATSFNRDARQSVTFSSSQSSVPLVAGVQDRLSVLFQIGGLLLANAEQGAAGGHIQIPVAGIRGEVENWTFASQGVEAIETGAGPLSTTHLRRSPKPGSNDRTIDVWIAQQNGGYPARVLYTEPNGSTVEMTLDSIAAPR